MHTSRSSRSSSANVTTGRPAAFVVEPIQGWAGSIMPPDDFFPQLRAFCDRHQMLLIADEVLTCMGRTGQWLAMEHWDTVADISTLGKGFGNGFPVTAMVAREEIKASFDQISASTSYGGNPMACAAALASIEVIEEENLLENAQRLERFFRKRLERMKLEHPIVGDVRVKGCLLGIELVKDRETKEPFDEAGNGSTGRPFRRDSPGSRPVISYGSPRLSSWMRRSPERAWRSSTKLSTRRKRSLGTDGASNLDGRF